MDKKDHSLKDILPEKMEDKSEQFPEFLQSPLKDINSKKQVLNKTYENEEE